MKLQTSGTTRPPSVKDNGTRFPGKNFALQHVSYLAVSKRKTLKQESS